MRKTFILVLLILAYQINTSFSNTIFVDLNATGNNNGSSWQNAYTDIQDALSAAVNGSEIWVATGTYYPGNSTSDKFSLEEGVELYGGFLGNETSREQRDWLENPTILSGDIGTQGVKTDNISRIIQVSNVNSCVIDGFTIRDGYSTGFIASGMYIATSSPTVSNCKFINNESDGSFSSGGAVTIEGQGGASEPWFTNCTFEDNTCSVIGGAVHSNDAVNNSVFIGCLFDNNTADRGGAIHNGGGIVKLYHCTIAYNTTEKGAATYTTSGNTTSIYNSIVWNNTATQTGLAVENSSGSANTSVNYSIVQGGYSGTGNSSSNPMFLFNGNFNLQISSPAIDAAASLPSNTDLPETDLNNEIRVVFGTADLGAYEYQCQSPQLSTTSTIVETKCNSYTTPGGTILFTSGTYMDTIPNSNGCDSIITIDLTINAVDVAISRSGLTLTANDSNATYQWLNCSGGFTPISGETGQSFTASTNGEYAVMISSNNCTDTSSCETITGVGLFENQETTAWRIYPNPTTGKFHIAGGDEDVEVIVYTVEGRLVASHDVLSNSPSYITLDGAPGMYFITIRNANGVVVNRRVIKK